MDILSRFEELARQSADHPAIVDSTGSYSFSDLLTLARQCASTVRGIGISRGDRCIVAETNSANVAIAILAIWYCRAIPVLFHSQSTQIQTRNVIAKTTAKLIITSGEIDLSDSATEIQTWSSASLLASSGTTEHDRYIEHQSASASQIASIVFTSGSTGGPKGVVQSHHSLISGCNAVYQCLRYQPDDSILCPVPWSFDYGFGQFLTTILTGITQVLPPKHDPFSICQTIEKHKPSIFAGVPSLFAGLCQGLSPMATTNASSVRLITSTGSKLHPSTADAMKMMFPNAEISLNYGLTETYRSTSLALSAFDTHRHSVGKAIPGVSISVIRLDNTIADPGEVGEIVHSGGSVFSGYWDDRERTETIRRPDPLWDITGVSAPPSVYTGDLGWKDAEGFLYINGRKDRQIKTMGILVNPDEIETTLLDSELLQEAAVVSKPHETLGELIVAIYVVKMQVTASKKELKTFCRSVLSPYMMPREFQQVDNIPKTNTGKVDYTKLKELYASSVISSKPD